MADQPTTPHMRILAAIDDAEVACATTRAHGALRAVVALHRQAPCDNGYAACEVGSYCAGCDPLNEDSCATNPWPCPTIRTIAVSLALEPS
jgi:hypothetical protein